MYDHEIDTFDYCMRVCERSHGYTRGTDEFKLAVQRKLELTYSSQMCQSHDHTFTANNKHTVAIMLLKSLPTNYPKKSYDLQNKSANSVTRPFFPPPHKRKKQSGLM